MTNLHSSLFGQRSASHSCAMAFDASWALVALLVFVGSAAGQHVACGAGQGDCSTDENAETLLMQTRRESVQGAVLGQSAVAQPGCSSGTIPSGLLPSDFAYVGEAMPDSEQYEGLCTGEYSATTQLMAPGEGGLQNLAIAKCANSDGCPVIRLFDKGPANLPASVAESEGLPTTGPDGEKLTADDCGHYFDPLSGAEGMSKSAYFQATGICDFEYADGSYPGNIGTFLLQCTLPQGYLVATGQTQSTTCKTEGGSEYTAGPQNTQEAATAPLQFYGFNSLASAACKYCVLEDGSASSCASSWTSTACP